MAYTLNDYLKQKAAGQAVVGFPSSTAASSATKKPLAPRLPAPSFSVATAPPVTPAIATWDDIKLAALPLAPALPSAPDPYVALLPVAPVKSGLANTTPRFSVSPTLDYVTRTSAPPQPEKPSFWERSSALSNTPTAPSIWDRASKLNQPATPAAPSFGNWGAQTNAAGPANSTTVTGFTAPTFTGPSFTAISETPGAASTGNAFTATAGAATPSQPFDAVSAFSRSMTTPFDAATAFTRPSATPPGASSSIGSTGILSRLQTDGSTRTGNGLSPSSQSILDDINRIKRDNNIGDFDRLGIRLNSLSEGIAAGLDANIAQARFERVVEDAVAEGTAGPIVKDTSRSSRAAFKAGNEQPADMAHGVQPLFTDLSDAWTNDSTNQPDTHGLPHLYNWNPDASVDLDFLVPVIESYLENTLVYPYFVTDARQLIEMIESGDVTAGDALEVLGPWESVLYDSMQRDEDRILANSIVGSIVGGIRRALPWELPPSILNDLSEEGAAAVARLFDSADGRITRYDPDAPGFHGYAIEHPNFCSARCTPEDMIDALSRFTVPGLDWHTPAVSGETYDVYHPVWDEYGGQIQFTSLDGGLTTINRTLPGHMFHDGQIIRTAVQRDDGSWSLITVGIGVNRNGWVAIENELLGPGVFLPIDYNMMWYLNSVTDR